VLGFFSYEEEKENEEPNSSLEDKTKTTSEPKVANDLKSQNSSKKKLDQAKSAQKNT
jgi:hypothetical protein